MKLRRQAAVRVVCGGGDGAVVAIAVAQLKPLARGNLLLQL
jgi:hypothetical protein